MRKILVSVAIASALLLASKNKVAAQNKFGYFDIDCAISLMPGIGPVDTLLTAYERDSLGQQYQTLLKEYMVYDSLLRVRNCGIGRKTNEMKKENEKIFHISHLLKNWMQYSQQAMQARYQQLRQPFYDKVIVAYQEVMDEGKYTYVFKRDALLHAPQSDNLIIAVIKKLGIKVTDEMLLQAAPTIPHTLASPKLRFSVKK